MCNLCFLFCFFFPLQLSSSVLWYRWLGLLTCKNRLLYNLYCVGVDVKHYTVSQSFVMFDIWALWRSTLSIRGLIALRSSLNDDRHIFDDLPWLHLPLSGTQFMTVLASLSFGWHSKYKSPGPHDVWEEHYLWCSEALSQSLWSLMAKQVLTYTMTAPYTFLSGLILISELLPIPLPVQTNEVAVLCCVSIVIHCRKLWYVCALRSRVVQLVLL